jgi:hypothetical protein
MSVDPADPGADEMPWEEPEYPGVEPDIEGMTSRPVIKRIMDEWERAMKAFHTAQEVDNALKGMLLDAMDYKYYCSQLSVACIHMNLKRLAEVWIGQENLFSQDLLHFAASTLVLEA